MDFWPSDVEDLSFSIATDGNGRPLIHASPRQFQDGAGVEWDHFNSIAELIPPAVRARNEAPMKASSIELSVAGHQFRIHRTEPKVFQIEVLQEKVWKHLKIDIYFSLMSCSNSGTTTDRRACLGADSFLSGTLNLDRQKEILIHSSLAPKAVILGFAEFLSGEVYNSVVHFDTSELLMIFPETNTARFFRSSYDDTST